MQKSLYSGVLLATPLVDADSRVYAVAQGGLSFGCNNHKRQKGNKSSASTIGGAIIEKELEFSLQDASKIILTLHNPINDNFANIARAEKPSTVIITIPESHEDNVMPLLSNIEFLEVSTDNIA